MVAGTEITDSDAGRGCKDADPWRERPPLSSTRACDRPRIAEVVLQDCTGWNSVALAADSTVGGQHPSLILPSVRSVRCPVASRRRDLHCVDGLASPAHIYAKMDGQSFDEHCRLRRRGFLADRRARTVDESTQSLRLDARGGVLSLRASEAACVEKFCVDLDERPRDSRRNLEEYECELVLSAMHVEVSARGFVLARADRVSRHKSQVLGMLSSILLTMHRLRIDDSHCDRLAPSEKRRIYG